MKTKHKGVLIEVREVLELSSSGIVDIPRFKEALQKLDALIASVPDGLDQSLIWFEDPGENSRVYAAIIAAQILSEAVEVG